MSLFWILESKSGVGLINDDGDRIVGISDRKRNAVVRSNLERADRQVACMRLSATMRLSNTQIGCIHMRLRIVSAVSQQKYARGAPADSQDSIVCITLLSSTTMSSLNILSFSLGNARGGGA